MNSTGRMARLALPLLLAGALAGCGLFKGGGPKTTPTLGKRTPVLSHIEAGAAADPAMKDVSVVLPPPHLNQNWSQPGGSADKNEGHLQLGDSPTVAWTAQIAGSSNKERLAAAPVIGAGKLFAVDTTGTVSAFDTATGAPVWTHAMNIAANQRNSAFGGGVSFDNGRVYATSGVGEVVALNADTGEQVWRATPAGPLRGSPTVAFNLVFVMTQDNQIFALDSATGNVEWQEAGASTQAGIFGVASPAAGQGTVIAGYSSGELTAYRYENGRTLWSDALARTTISTEVGSLTDIDADPIIDNGRVYALGQGGRMAAYELVTGQRIWELNLAGISTPAIAGEWIFTLTDDARLLAIARGTGKIRWITQLPRYRKPDKKEDPIFWKGPVLANNNLYVTNSRGELWRVSVGEGSAQLMSDLKAPISLPPVLADKTLYVLDDSGRITAFR